MENFRQSIVGGNSSTFFAMRGLAFFGPLLLIILEVRQSERNPQDSTQSSPSSFCLKLSVIPFHGAMCLEEAK
jgi:hypothetical protein